MDMIFPLALKKSIKSTHESEKQMANDKKLEPKCVLNDWILSENYEPFVCSLSVFCALKNMLFSLLRYLQLLLNTCYTFS